MRYGLFKTCTVSLWIIFLIAVSPLVAYVSIKAEYKGEYYPILDCRLGHRVYIEVEGERRSIKRSIFSISHKSGIPFKGGYFEIKDRIMESRAVASLESGDIFNDELAFRAKIRTSVDLECCYIALEISSGDFVYGILLHEIPDLKAGEWIHVSFRVPTDGSWRSGTVNQYLFTNGQQVLQEGPFNKLKKKILAREARSRHREDAAPRILAPYSPGFPEALLGVIETGEVQIEFTIGKEGHAHSINVLESTHPLLEIAAVKAIEKSRYQAAVKNGQNVPTRLRQTIKFVAPSDGKADP
jgi:TonB family protein